MSAELQRTEIGEFPSTWEVNRVDYAFDIQQGKQVSSRNRDGEHQRPFLRTKNVFWNRLDLADLDEMHFSEAEQSRLELRANDLLVCEGGSIGRTALWKNEVQGCLYQNHLHRLRAKGDKAHPQFGVYWLWYAFDVAKLYFGRGNVTTIPNLSHSKLAELPMAIPPLPEQKKIAHILSTVQRAIEAQERIIQTTTELKKALMHKLFTEGLPSIDASTGGLRHEPQKQTEIGPVPESWEVVKLGKHIQIAHGYAFKGEFFVTDGPTVLTPGNFKLDGGLYWGKRTKYTTESYEPNVVLNPGELVVVMTDLTPTAKLLGGPAFIPEGRTILHNQRIGKVELKGSKTTLQFLYWVFLSESFKRYMRQTATGSTVRHTSPSKIYQYAFGLPSLEEQAQAVDCLTKVDAKLANAEDKKRALEDLFRTLLHELMTAKTRVHALKLETQN